MHAIVCLIMIFRFLNVYRLKVYPFVKRRVSMGFLGTLAGFPADVNLILQVVMLGVLLIGRSRAKRKNFGKHGRYMAVAVTLNAASLATVMVPSLRLQRSCAPRLSVHCSAQSRYNGTLPSERTGAHHRGACVHAVH